MAGGLQIAYRFTPGGGPAIVFLPGYMSDMEGGKATAVFDWAREQGRACLLMDYSGCGQSSGQFAEGALSRWKDEVIEMIARFLPDRDVVLVGSSMGGWLMLLAGLILDKRLAGLVGIAPAPDFTEWGYDAEQKAALKRGQTIFEENEYGPDPTPTHALFWADGQANLLLDSGDIAIACPVRILQGQQDPDVPWGTSLRLAEALRSDDVQVTLIKDGDHRLSRDEDIALLLDLITSLPSKRTP